MEIEVKIEELRKKKIFKTSEEIEKLRKKKLERAKTTLENTKKNLRGWQII